MSMYSSPMLQRMKEIPILILILKNFIKQSKNRKTYFTFSFALFNVSELGFPSAWSSVVSAFALASCSAFFTFFVASSIVSVINIYYTPFFISFFYLSQLFKTIKKLLIAFQITGANI